MLIEVDRVRQKDGGGDIWVIGMDNHLELMSLRYDPQFSEMDATQIWELLMRFTQRLLESGEVNLKTR